MTLDYATAKMCCSSHLNPMQRIKYNFYILLYRVNMFLRWIVPQLASETWNLEGHTPQVKQATCIFQKVMLVTQW